MSARRRKYGGGPGPPSDISRGARGPLARQEPVGRAADSLLPTPADFMLAGVKSVSLTASLICSAYLMALSLGAPRHAWVAWLALLPLFVSIRALRPLGAMLCGALWGLGLYAFRAGPAETGISAGFGSLALLTTIPAIYTWSGSWLTRRFGFSPLVLGVSWMGVELAFEPLGLRSGLLAGTQSDTALMYWVGGALGYVLVAFIVALVSASLVSVLSDLGLAIPRPQLVTASSGPQRRFTPQVLACLPLCANPLSRPRAPPG